MRLIWLSVCDESSLVDLHVQDYKSFCAAVTISATVVVPQKIDFYILTPVTPEKKVKLGMKMPGGAYTSDEPAMHIL